MQTEVQCFWCGQMVDQAGVYTDQQGVERRVCDGCIDNAETAPDPSED